MKIAIMTVPFNNNYGGFLQAFALKRVLLDMGHEVIFIMRRRDYQRIYTNRWKNLIRYILRKDNYCQFLNDYRQKKLSIHTDKFVKRYLLPWTKEYYRSYELEECRELDADVFIAGSDQCWRSKFAPAYIDDYFFKFLKGTNKKRIAYAASFGTEEFEYSPEMQDSCTELLKEFSAISVRESSGIDLLERYFDVPKGKAIEVLDPTFLPPVDVYKDMIKDFPVNESEYLFTYILDESEDKQELINSISDKYRLKVINQEAQTKDVSVMKPIEPVELWLSRIAHASFVVTDSFHGTVFSILFNKPFIVYGNVNRGVTRFKALLGKFGLEDRYIDCKEHLDKIAGDSSIDWNSVNAILKERRDKSIFFLKQSLK